MEVSEGVAHMQNFAFSNLNNYFTTGNLFMMSETYTNDDWDAEWDTNAPFTFTVLLFNRTTQRSAKESTMRNLYTTTLVRNTIGEDDDGTDHTTSRIKTAYSILTKEIPLIYRLLNF